MRSNLFILLSFLSVSVYGQDSTAIQNNRKQIMDRFTQITGDDENCGDTISSLQREIAYHKKENGVLRDSLYSVKEKLFLSEKRFLVHKYGETTTKILYDKNQYNDFKSSLFLNEFLENDGSVNIFFPFNEAKVDFSMYQELKGLVEQCKKSSTNTLIIRAYADAAGSENLNTQLSYARADAIKKYIVQNFDFPENRIDILGLGSNSKERFKESEIDFLNRRAVVRIGK